jgi:hypothetical protein
MYVGSIIFIILSGHDKHPESGASIEPEKENIHNYPSDLYPFLSLCPLFVAVASYVILYDHHLEHEIVHYRIRHYGCGRVHALDDYRHLIVVIIEKVIDESLQDHQQVY